MNYYDKQLKEIITLAVTETIENMAFMAVDVSEGSPAEASADESISVSLLVLEPWLGEFRLLMPMSTALAIAQSLYSTDDPALITGNMLHDVTAELLNTIAGKVMKTILPSESPFLLGLPQIGEDTFVKIETVPVQCDFTVDDNFFRVMVYLDLLGEAGGL